MAGTAVPAAQQPALTTPAPTMPPLAPTSMNQTTQSTEPVAVPM